MPLRHQAAFSFGSEPPYGMTEGSSSPFQWVTALYYVHLPPHYIGRIQEGVNEALNALLMKWNEELGGVVLAYNNASLTEDHGKLIGASAYIHFHVSLKVLLWMPSIGAELTGTVNHISVDHVGLVTAGVFSVAIEADHLLPGHSYEGDSNTWRLSPTAPPASVKGSKNRPITLGSQLVFRVARVSIADGLVSLSGVHLKTLAAPSPLLRNTTASNTSTMALPSVQSTSSPSSSAPGAILTSSSSGSNLHIDASSLTESSLSALVDSSDPMALETAALSFDAAGSDAAETKKKAKRKRTVVDDPTTDDAKSDRRSKKSRRRSAIAEDV